MPSITKSISIMLLVGATANVFAAPSRRALGDILSGSTDTTPAGNVPGSDPTGTGALGDATAVLGDTTSGLVDSVTTVIQDATGGSDGSLTSGVVSTVPDTTATGNILGLGVCAVKDGDLIYSMIGAATLMLNGGSLPAGCTQEQTKQCGDKETQADQDAAKQMCPNLNTCDPTEVANVWRDCMMDKCKQDGKCPCKECGGGNDDPKPPTCQGNNCSKPSCQGKDCSKPTCKGNNCSNGNDDPKQPPKCQGKDCSKPICKGNDCSNGNDDPKPPKCQGNDCNPPPCKECTKPKPPCETCSGASSSGASNGNTKDGSTVSVNVPGVIGANVNVK